MIDQGEIPDSICSKQETGLQNSYGLYNRKEKYITESNPENLDQKMYITTFNGKYLACNKEGKFYLVNDFQDSNINQSELEWTIVSLENNSIAVLNPYSMYLMVGIEIIVLKLKVIVLMLLPNGK